MPGHPPNGRQYEVRDEAFANWDKRQDFTMNNRRQTAKLGFMAGWHLRKVHELNTALRGDLSRTYGRGWWRERIDEIRALAEFKIARFADGGFVPPHQEAGVTTEGRNWFRDSRGRVWVDVPAAAMTSFGIPASRPLSVEEAFALYRAGYFSKSEFMAEIDSNLDAGIPTG